jgi:Na+:H+ antiporter, NhaA family
MRTVTRHHGATLLHGTSGETVHHSGRHGPGHPPRHAHVTSRGRMSRLWHLATEYLLAMPLGVIIALVWANTAPESYFRTSSALHFLVTDVGMVLFFGLIMKEVVEATVPGGVLHPWRRAALPFVASLGLTLLPVLVYAFVVTWLDEPRVLEGWPALFATDIAFGYFMARLIFGRHPVIPFFVVLAICANGLGLLALGFAGTSPGVHLGVAASLMAVALTIAGMLRRMRVRSLWPYVVGAGAFSWCALYYGGLEPAFALVPVLAFVPHASRDPGFFVDAPLDARDPLNRFEIWMQHPAQLALLLFGIVGAGVPLRALDWGTLGLPLTAVLAKPVGLLLGVAVALALGLHLPARVGWRDLLVVGFIASVGFTISLFFASASVAAGPTLSELKMGALLSISGAVAALAAAAVLRTGRFAR